LNLNSESLSSIYFQGSWNDLFPQPMRYRTIELYFILHILFSSQAGTKRWRYYVTLAELKCSKSWALGYL
jgi:hypothetical protein